MEKLLDPKIDFIFKNIFGNKTTPNVLISLLNSVICYNNKRKIITSVVIEDSFIKKENLEDKYAILDIKATLNDGTKVDIEIQVVDEYNMEPRILYYLSRLFSEQIGEGDKYTDLKKAITINILNFNLIKNDRYHNHYLLKEYETNEIFSELLQVHTIELKKFHKGVKEITDDLESWVEFLKEPKEEVVEMLSERVPEIKEAFEILKVVSRDKDTKRDAEIREKALRDKVSNLASAREEGIGIGVEKGIGIGKKEGREEGDKTRAIKAAKKGLAKGLDVETISYITELSIEEIKSLTIDN